MSSTAPPFAETRTEHRTSAVGRVSWTLCHPYALAVFPVITIWAGNIREVTVQEGLTVILFMFFVAFLGMQLVRRFRVADSFQGFSSVG